MYDVDVHEYILLEDVRAMSLHCFDANVQLPRDLLVARPLGDERQDLLLTCCEAIVALPFLAGLDAFEVILHD